MNPETNKFEELLSIIENDVEQSKAGYVAPLLLRPNGEPVPKHWTVLSEGENVVIKDYTFQVAHIGESYFVLEPVGPIIIGAK